MELNHFHQIRMRNDNGYLPRLFFYAKHSVCYLMLSGISFTQHFMPPARKHLESNRFPDAVSHVLIVQKSPLSMLG